MSKKRPTVLVVEDEDLLRKAITNKLKAAGMAVLEASDGNEAFEKLAAGVDLVWLDMYLPDHDGNYFLERLKKDELRSDTPVIVVSVSARALKFDETSKGLNIKGVYSKTDQPLRDLVDVVKGFLA